MGAATALDTGTSPATTAAATANLLRTAVSILLYVIRHPTGVALPVLPLLGLSLDILTTCAWPSRPSERELAKLEAEPGAAGATMTRSSSLAGSCRYFCRR
jgi:hypothetical protein